MVCSEQDCSQCGAPHLASHSCAKRLSGPARIQAHSQDDANVWTEDESKLTTGSLSVRILCW